MNIAEGTLNSHFVFSVFLALNIVPRVVADVRAISFRIEDSRPGIFPPSISEFFLEYVYFSLDLVCAITQGFELYFQITFVLALMSKTAVPSPNSSS